MAKQGKRAMKMILVTNKKKNKQNKMDLHEKQCVCSCLLSTGEKNNVSTLRLYSQHLTIDSLQQQMGITHVEGAYPIQPGLYVMWHHKFS